MIGDKGLSEAAIGEQGLYLEDSILKTLMASPALLPLATRHVDERTFSWGVNKIIWKELCEIITPELGKAEQPRGGTGLLTQLKARLKAHDVQGICDAADKIFINGATATHRLNQVSKEAAEIALRGRIAQLIESYPSKVRDTSESLEEVLGDASTRINEFTDQHRESGKNWKVRSGETVGDVEEYLKTPELKGLSSGIQKLDELLCGLMPGELSVFCARPAAGKSSLAAYMADHNAKQGKSVLFISLEMDASLLDFKRLAIMTGIPSWKFRRKSLTADEGTAMAVVMEEFKSQKFYYDADPNLTISSIRASIDFYAQVLKGVDLIVVDYLQLLARDPNNLNNEIDLITKSLRAIAKTYGAHMLCLAQLSRGVEQRADKRPIMSDLRSSGAIEQHADQIIGIYRDEYYNPQSVEPCTTELGVLKNRNGTTGVAKVCHDLSISTYYS